MATIKRFEDLKSWQKSRELVNNIYEFTNEGTFADDDDLKRQVRRAAVSIMSNIAEGFERSGNREFIQFLSIAKGSAGEVRAQLYIAKDRKYIDSATFENLLNQCVATSKLIGGLITYLQETTIRGSKFKEEDIPYQTIFDTTENQFEAEL